MMMERSARWTRETHRERSLDGCFSIASRVPRSLSLFYPLIFLVFFFLSFLSFYLSFYSPPLHLFSLVSILVLFPILHSFSLSNFLISEHVLPNAQTAGTEGKREKQKKKKKNMSDVRIHSSSISRPFSPLFSLVPLMVAAAVCIAALAKAGIVHRSTVDSPVHPSNTMFQRPN
jgi:ABC-type transport system involved in multi-copper enzyme maturation permease subunit